MKKWLLVAVLAVVGAVLAACGSDEATTASGEDGKTVLKYQQYTGNVYPDELAEALGYFENIELETVSDYKGGPESIQLVGTNDINYGWAFTGALIKSASKNVDVKSVIGVYGSDDENFYGAYTLEDSEIETAKDLIGKKVGINILGAHANFTIVEYLRKGGLTEEEIKQVELVTIPLASAEQSLRQGNLDVVMLLGAAQDLAINRGGLKRLYIDTEVFGFEFTGGNYFFNEKFIESNPEVVADFTQGVAKAIEWSKTTPRDEVIAKFEQIITERNENETIDNVKFWKSYGVSAEGGIITDEEYNVWIDWLVESGELKEGEIQPSELYTNEYNPYAK